MCLLPKHPVSKGKQFRQGLFLTLFLVGISSTFFVETSIAQFVTSPATNSLKGENNVKTDVFSSNSEFIENIGQYGNDVANFSSLGKIEFGYEGFEMPVLFTSKGIIHLQRKVVGPSEEEREAAEREENKLGKKGTKEEELEQLKAIDRTVVMEWVDANPDCKIITSTPETAYHTYGFLTSKAKGYKKITYANLHDGIDVELSLDPSKAAGFEYKIIAQAGADISKVKMKYAGDIKKMRLNSSGDCVVKSDFDKIKVTAPLAFYQSNSTSNEPLKVKFNLQDKLLSFEFPDSYDSTNALVNFTDLSSASSSWVWDFGDFAGSSTDPNPSYTYADTGHYQVSLIISDSHNCLDTSEAEIIIEGAFTFYLPNSFSPNNDGINDYFEGHGIGIKMQEMTIFDRWGKQFYYEKAPHPKWDGRSIFLGEYCPEDAYVYLILVEDIFHQQHEYRGLITLIR